MTNVPDAPPRATPRRIPRAVRAGISVALLAWLVTRIPLQDAIGAMREARLLPLALAVPAIVAGQVLRAARTCALLRGGVRLADIGPMLRMQMLAFLPGMFSPAKAGELLKVELLRREWDVSIARGTGAFLAERLADVMLLGLAALWGLAGVFGRDIPGAAYVLIGGAVVGVLGVVLAFRVRLLPEVLHTRLQAALADVRWAPTLVTTVLYWGVVVGIVWLFTRSVQSTAGYAALVGAVPLSLLTALVPISLGGFGVREGAMVLLFQHAAVGCTEAQALAVSLLYDVLGLGIPALMGVAYMWTGPRHE